MEKSYYAIIPANVRYDKDLIPNAKLLYGEITALSNEKGYCWAYNSYFAELYGVSKTSISKWVNQLIAKGYLKSTIIYRDGTKEILNRYLTIIIVGIEEKLNTPIKEKLKDNNTLINNTINNKKKETEFDILINSYTTNEDLKNNLYDFIKARSALKKNLTTEALKRIMNKLDKLASDDYTKIKIIDNSIMNGWSGVFELRGENNGSFNKNTTESKKYNVNVENKGLTDEDRARAERELI